MFDLVVKVLRPTIPNRDRKGFPLLEHETDIPLLAKSVEKCHISHGSVGSKQAGPNFEV